MALIAEVKTAFGTYAGAYYYLAEYKPNRTTGTIEGKLVIFKDRATREGFKTAQRAIADAQATIETKNAAANKVVMDFNALPPEQQTQQARASADANQAQLRAEIAAQHAAQQTAFFTIQANSPGGEQSFTIPTGAVPPDADGDIAIAQIYDWLRANDLKGAENI